MRPVNRQTKRKHRSVRIVSNLVCLSFLAASYLLFSSSTADKEETNMASSHKITYQIINTPTVQPMEQIAPIQGKVISPFGYRGRHHHTGADIKLQRGDTVKAVFNGRVTRSCYYFGYGNMVVLKHINNLETYYSHLSKCLVHVGDSIAVGQSVGLGGRTGRATTDHLHFEVRHNKVPENPERYFDFANNSVRIPFIVYSPVPYTPAPQRAITATVKPVRQEIADKLEADNITIRKGDTLYALARKYGSTVKQIQEINNLPDTHLSIGMKLKLK